MNEKKQKEDELKFKNWKSRPSGGRIYWYDIKGWLGWKARYIKETDSNENTLKFYQEIYDQEGIMVEIHVKFPEDKGHRKL